MLGNAMFACQQTEKSLRLDDFDRQVSIDDVTESESHVIDVNVGDRVLVNDMYKVMDTLVHSTQ